MSKKKKSGKPFEECVADVAQAIDPQPTVQQGQWVDGPDGYRDLDVFIEARVDDKPFKVLIECKDYDRAKTGPVGISIIDALDSKRRDLQIDLAMVCSNAGFTEPAIRKAKRLGIVLIGVVREGDARIRHQLIDHVYFRRLKIEHLGFKLQNGEHECSDISASLDNEPIANWVCHHTRSLIASNPMGGGQYAGTFRFKCPTTFQLRNGEFVATQMFVEFILSGGWFEQCAIIDGSAGFYDWIRRRVRVGSGPYQFHVQEMDLTKGSPIESPPLPELSISEGGIPGEVWMQLLYLRDANCHEPVPLLDSLIVDEDLDLRVSGLPAHPNANVDQNAGRNQHF